MTRAGRERNRKAEQQGGKDFSWGDCDNDGDLDLAVARYWDATNLVYQNNGDGTFGLLWTSAETDDTGSVGWGDFNGDGVLDLAAGNDLAPHRVYLGSYEDFNFAPTAPTGLSGLFDYDAAFSTITFRWDSGDYDSNGVTETIHYALAVATVPMQVSGDGLRIIYPSSAPTSDISTFTLTWTYGSPLLGNFLRPAYDGDDDKHYMMLTEVPDENNLQMDATYYFRVQAIDAGLRRGPWSAEAEVFTGIADWNSVWNSAETEESVSVVWGDYDKDGDLDLAIGSLGGTNRVYRNDGGGSFAPMWNSAEAESTYSVGWGDFDNDGDLDIVSGNNAKSNRVHRSGGDGTFVTVWSSVETDFTISCTWGDFDNDGDLDFAAGNYGQASRVYRNEADGTFGLIWNAPTAEDTRSVAWGDYDNDGILDLAFGSRNNQSNRVYRSNGNGAFSSVWNSVETEETQSVAWGDYDGDGDLDLASGNDSETNRIYRNKGGGNFEAIWNSPESESTQSLVWGDFDSNGDLDFAVGNINGQVDRAYRNNGGGRFSSFWTSAETEDSYEVAWGDLDGDGDLDLAAANYILTNRVYSGSNIGYNAPPSAPTGLVGVFDYDVDFSTLAFKWDSGDYDSSGDTETIHYQIAVATVPMQVSGDNLTIVYPSSAPTSDSSTFTYTWTGGSPLLGTFLRPAYDANDDKHYVMLSTTPNMGNLKTDTTYYFRVQAIDTGLRRGQWSSEEAVYTGLPSWSSVWNSQEAEDTRGLSWGDFDNDGDLDMAAGTYNMDNRVYRNNGAGTFALVWNSGEGEPSYNILWGDYDNDGDLDMAVGNDGDTNRVYRSEGNGAFISVWNSLETENTQGIAWGDYDNDGDLDLAAANYSFTTNRVYRNNGDGTFTSAWNDVEGDGTFCLDWGDYDNDGDLDLLASNDNPQTDRVYRNDGQAGFVAVWNSANSDNTRGAAWGDFDSDGDLDFAVATVNGSPRTNRVYRNDGGGSFPLIWNSPDDEDSVNVSWGDYDNDGNLDLAVANRNFQV
ncbi:FG-GAP repeat domain-containing protein [Elusimicrobiota bacterium]